MLNFWFKKKSFIGWLLSPLGNVYAWFSKKRLACHPIHCTAPIICVGNLTLGGAGKTPTVIALAERLGGCIVSKGYKGSQKNPYRVQEGDSPYLVGDEALLLMKAAPTWIGKSRLHAVKKAIDSGFAPIIMDDGFQNPYVYKNFSLAVVDGKKGFGNEKVFPAGPLRENLYEGIKRADAILIIDGPFWHPAFDGKKIFYGKKEIDTSSLSGPVIAFAGIAYPERFYTMLQDHGIHINKTFSFLDHHMFRDKEIKHILKYAKETTVVTTYKDYVRLPEWAKEKIIPINLKLTLDEELYKELKKAMGQL